MTELQKRWLLVLTVVTVAFVYLLLPILAPFLAGMLLAYMADPIADRLEAKGISRTGSVIIVFVGMTLLLILAVLLVLPSLGKQIETLTSLLPEGWAMLQQKVVPLIERWTGFDIDSTTAVKAKQAITGNLQQTTDVVAMLISQATKSSLSLVTWIANLALVPVVTFYLLRDWDVMVARIRDYLPRNLEPKVSLWASECDDVLGAFVRGQLTVMAALGAIYAVGLALVGLKLALLIGVLAGLASIVPYLGVIVGLGMALIAAIMQFDTWLPLVWVCVVFGIGQMLEGMVLTPNLVGDKIGLHPVVVIFAVLAGGQLFGFVGILLALPAAAVIRVLMVHLFRHYKDGPLYQNDALLDAAGDNHQSGELGSGADEDNGER
ncbi:AI-2E family transporter [Pokkaliibacter plantistimulans]|uniref:AI-2E family transporter n=1 Tax=Proteobacteria bacterium 228 TaxID=2083153 RepID=A0A2S5KH77_9PROT|nr:AI-2E family transporter [Pokkaliibacter plantistimulans]PPC74161.1 AI-2E family transporter [Pokkaliibacter plantistimulans]